MKWSANLKPGTCTWYSRWIAKDIPGSMGSYSSGEYARFSAKLAGKNRYFVLSKIFDICLFKGYRWLYQLIDMIYFIFLYLLKSEDGLLVVTFIILNLNYYFLIIYGLNPRKEVSKLLHLLIFSWRSMSPKLLQILWKTCWFLILEIK